MRGFDELLDRALDGIVLATPSALHADQAIAALERGLAVFCQKPLARNAFETRRVVDAARSADRLLGVDLSYRWTAAARAVAERVRGGDIGRVFAVELAFHNAYGPDKPWFYDRRLAGGGCVLDLAIHLVDLALWVLDFPRASVRASRLFAQGRSIDPRRSESVEDFATALLELEGGVSAALACSWKLSVGRDAVIRADFFGERGGVRFANRDGSFYDFTAELFRGTRGEVLASPPDAWGGRAAVDWTRRLAAGERFDPQIETAVSVATVLDEVYQRCAS